MVIVSILVPINASSGIFFTSLPIIIVFTDEL